MDPLLKQKARAGLVAVTVCFLLIMTVLSTSAFGSSSSYNPFSLPNLQQSVQTCKAANHTTAATESNFTMANAINFIRPDLSILYPVGWNALPNIPTGEV